VAAPDILTGAAGGDLDRVSVEAIRPVAALDEHIVATERGEGIEDALVVDGA